MGTPGDGGNAARGLRRRGGSAAPPGDTAAQRRARLCAPSTAPRRSALIVRFGFVRAEAERPGLAAGFDLDGRVSTADVTFEARLAFVNP